MVDAYDAYKLGRYERIWLKSLRIMSNPKFSITDVVTFRLRGRCVFLLQVFTRLGHECQDVFSPCDGMHVCRPRFVLSSERGFFFFGMESETLLTPKEKSPKPEAQRRVTRDSPSRRTASPTHYQLSYFGPPIPYSYGSTIGTPVSVLPGVTGSALGLVGPGLVN